MLPIDPRTRARTVVLSTMPLASKEILYSDTKGSEVKGVRPISPPMYAILIQGKPMTWNGLVVADTEARRVKDTLGGGARLSYAAVAPRLNQMTSGSRNLCRVNAHDQGMGNQERVRIGR